MPPNALPPDPASARVLVPAKGSMLAAVVHSGSGVVGWPDPGRGTWYVYYEGNLHGAANIVTWGDRCKQAFDRLTFGSGAGYPTVARGHYSALDFHVVGYMDPARGVELEDDLVVAKFPVEPASQVVSDWIGIPIADLGPELVLSTYPGGT